MKEWRKILHANSNQIRLGVAIIRGKKKKTNKPLSKKLFPERKKGAVYK